MKKAVIIGAGQTTRNFAKYMEELGYCFRQHFLMCLDNNSSLWGTAVEGVVIGAMEEIKKYPNTRIVISSIYKDEIRKQLEQLNVGNPIIGVVDYGRELLVNYQFDKYNAAHPVIENSRQDKIKELTVYTTIIGKYDSLREPFQPDENIHYVCFTDDKTLCSETWDIRYIDREYDEPILESRKYKMFPHLFIDTEYSLYVDAHVQFTKSPLDYMNQYFTRGNILLIPHFDRDCIYDEADACVYCKKDTEERMATQKNAYSEDNCPKHAGLFVGGIIGRKHFENEVIEFNKEWWKHFEKYSRRDQISLGYLIWKNNIEISLANINMCNNQWFTVGEHIM